MTELFDAGEGTTLRLLRYKEFRCADGLYVVFVSADMRDEAGDPYIYMLKKTADSNGGEQLSAPDGDISVRLAPFLADFVAGREHFVSEDEEILKIEVPQDGKMNF